MNVVTFFREFNQEKIDQAWEDIIAAKGTPEFDPLLNEALARGDELKIMAALFVIDKKLLEQYSRSNFTAPFKLDQEFLIEKAFDKALGIKLDQQDFYPGEAVAGVPLELWVDLFRKLSPQVVDQLKRECQRKSFPFDMFKQYLMGVKNVVKFCLDNNSRLVGYYSSAPGAFLRSREEAILGRLLPKEKRELA